MLLCEKITLAAFIWILYRTKVISSFDVKRLGCYHDKGYRALADTHHDDRMTLELCTKLCNKHKYLELQASNECFCENSLSKGNVFQKISDSECQLPCKGNTSQICGGVFANSVYKLIPVTLQTTKMTTPGHSTEKTTFMTIPIQSTVMTILGQSTVKTTDKTTLGKSTVTTTEMTTLGKSTVKTTDLATLVQSTAKTTDMATEIPTPGESTMKNVVMTKLRHSTVTTSDIITLCKSEVTTSDMKILGRSTSLQVTAPRTSDMTTIKTFGKNEFTSVQPIIPLVTSVQPIIPSKCLCPCSTIGKNKYDFLRGMNLSSDQLREILKQNLDLIKKELSVNKSNTTRMRRSKISAPDDRVSATSVGYVGVVFICFIGVLVVFFDILGCFVGKFKRRSSLQL